MVVRSEALGIVSLTALLILLAFSAEAAEFQCEWRNSSSCLNNQTMLFRVNSSEAVPPDNSHAQLVNYSGALYNVSLCCWSDSFRRMNNTCDGTDVVGLRYTNDSHIQIGTNTTYPYRACFNVTSGEVECEYPLSTCSAGYSEMFSMASSERPDNTTNSHIGVFGTYQRKVCCRVGGQNSPTLELVNLTPRNHTITRNGLWCQGINPADADGDSVSLHYNWEVDGKSQTLLNLPMDYDSSGVLTHDISGNGLHGTPVGGSFSPTQGYIGSGFDLSNTGYISIPTSTVLNSSRQISILAWVKPDAVSNSHAIVGAKSGSGYLFQLDSGSLQFWPNVQNSPSTSSAITYSADEWIHLAVTYDYDTGAYAFYKDSVSAGSGTNLQTKPTTSAVYVGRYNSGRHINASVDEVMIWNRTLSGDEIKTIFDDDNSYMNQSELSKNEYWSCSVVPVDSTGLNGTFYTSNTTLVRGSPPLNVTLLMPEDGNLSVFERYTNFTWTDADEIDGDAVTYNLNVTVEAGPCSNEIAQTSISDNNYTSPIQLCFDQNYKWNVTACDVDGCSDVSHETFNFTIQSFIGVTLINDSVNFSDVYPTEMRYTDNHTHFPFILENNGNVIVNVSFVANNSLFTSVGLDNIAFQFRVEENETDSINEAESQTTYTPVPSTWVQAIDDLNFSDWKDAVEIHLNVTVPETEPPGRLLANITVHAVISE